MSQNQNETGECGMRIADCGVWVANSRDLTDRRRDTTSLRNTSLPNSSPAAFTLVELLVVITIIAILAGLITGAAINALGRAKEASITLEIQQLSSAIEDFKNEFGAYPPNGMNPGTGVNNSLGNPISKIVDSDFQRMFKKAFPRNNEPTGVIRALAGTGGSASILPGGMSAAEAMVFWLGGFSSDPQFPLSGPGGPSFADTDGDGFDSHDDILENHKRRYEFDLGRLMPRDTNGVFTGRFIIYTVGGVQRRINFWQYAPSGSEQALVYFDTSRHKPAEYDRDLSGAAGLDIFALKQLRAGYSTSAIPTVNDLVFVNKGKFQILHAGLDDAWGNFSAFSIKTAASANDASAVLLFPTGPFTGDIADTVGNFGTGTLEDAQP